MEPFEKVINVPDYPPQEGDPSHGNLRSAKPYHSKDIGSIGGCCIHD
jgi:hypothetical protein